MTLKVSAVLSRVSHVIVLLRTLLVPVAGLFAIDPGVAMDEVMPVSAPGAR